MTKYKIIKNKDDIIVEIKDHAEYSNEYDMVCASISTAVTMTINALDNLGYNIMDFKKQDGYISFKVNRNDTVNAIIKTLEEVLNTLKEDYPNYVNTK